MLKKIKKIGKIFLGIVVVGFAIFEFYYYGWIDFRKSRKLTSGEKKFLSEIYRDSIEYQKVRIYKGKFFPTPIQDDNTAMSPNGNIYFSKKHFSEDFSKENIWDQAWLVHEVMHVKQYEKFGQIFAWKVAPPQLNYMIFGVSPYEYKIDFSKNFSDFNAEQQGDIAQDYFLFLHGQKKFSKKEIEWYKKLLNE